MPPKPTPEPVLPDEDVLSSSSEAADSSSVIFPSSDSFSSNSGNNFSSDSSNNFSSDSFSSSSANYSSSESGSLYTLTCSVIKSTIDPKPFGYSAAEIANIVKIVCKYNGESKEIDARNDVKWTDAPNWSGTVAGTFSSIKIQIYDDVDGCPDMEAVCIGTIIVQ